MLITAADVRGSPLRLSTVPAPMLVVTVWVTCVLLSAAAPANTPPAPTSGPGAPLAVTVGKPERHELRRTVEQPGHIEAFAETPLMAKIPGFVKAVHVDIGERVKAGQILAELSVPELEEELKQKQNQKPREAFPA